MNWRVSSKGLAQAKRELKVKLPVSFKYGVKNHGDRYGENMFTAGAAGWDGKVHTVMLSNTLTPELANHVALHELTHCAQRERALTPIVAELLYQHGEAQYGYEKNPFEVEANQRASELCDHVKVIIA